MKEYNIGDIVKISSSPHKGNSVISFIEEMECYIGKTAIITGKRKSYLDNFIYNIDLDRGWWSWSATFFEDANMVNIEDITLK